MCEHEGGEIERERETMKGKRKREKRANGGEKVVKQYNIRQALEHNNTERDKY